MNPSDKAAFKELMDGLSDYYQSKEKLSNMALKIYFSSLQNCSLEQVSEAVSRHLQDQDGGRFFPKVADIQRYIEGKIPSTDQIIGAARLADCPMGILARMHIGTWDLNNQDAFYLRQRAEEVLRLLPEWKARANSGDYSAHELARMIHHKIDPADPFYPGLMRSEAHQLISQKIAALPPPEPEDQPEKDPKPNPEGQKLIREAIKDITHNPDSKKPEKRENSIKLEKLSCENCSISFEKILNICPKCGEKRDAEGAA